MKLHRLAFVSCLVVCFPAFSACESSSGNGTCGSVTPPRCYVAFMNESGIYCDRHPYSEEALCRAGNFVCPPSTPARPLAIESSCTCIRYGNAIGENLRCPGDAGRSDSGADASDSSISAPDATDAHQDH